MHESLFRIGEEIEEKYPIHAAEALIFAGGLGTRAQELTQSFGVAVKHLLPTNYSGKVLLDHSIEAALQAGVGKVHLIISGHTAPAIVPHARHNLHLYGGVSFFEHDMPTAGVAQVFELFVKHKRPSGPLIKLEGDELNAGFNLADMYKFHVDGKHPITYLVTRGEADYRYKLFANASGLVEAVKTAPFSQADKDFAYDLSGTFIINPSMIEMFLRSGSTWNFLQQATAGRKLFIYHHRGQSINVNSRQDYGRITVARGF